MNTIIELAVSAPQADIEQSYSDAINSSTTLFQAKDALADINQKVEEVSAIKNMLSQLPHGLAPSNVEMVAKLFSRPDVTFFEVFPIENLSELTQEDESHLLMLSTYASRLLETSQLSMLNTLETSGIIEKMNEKLKDILDDQQVFSPTHN